MTTPTTGDAIRAEGAAVSVDLDVIESAAAVALSKGLMTGGYDPGDVLALVAVVRAAGFDFFSECLMHDWHDGTVVTCDQAAYKVGHIRRCPACNLRDALEPFGGAA